MYFLKKKYFTCYHCINLISTRSLLFDPNLKGLWLWRERNGAKMSEIVNNSVSGDTKKSTDASSNEQDDAPTFVQDKTTKNQDSL